MVHKTFLYIGAGILFLIGLCLLGFAGITLYGSTSPSGQANWVTTGVVLGIFGILVLAGGAGLVYAAIRGTKTEVIQQVTMKMDLPGETRIEQVKCKSCGGTLSAKDITLANGAPMVNCPFCHTIYQLTEEPKW
ncbi:MAG: hypothetical protein HY863_15895 [Chloroflexi bacterium]|nr:hypothetical protein [Chloroflexota bacterium]